MAQLACGSQHCLVLTAEGELYACGNNSHGELGVGDTAARPSPTRLDSLPSHMRFCAVSAGGSHSLTLTLTLILTRTLARTLTRTR